MPPGQGATIVEALYANARRHPQSPAMRHRDAGRPAGERWKIVAWAEYLSAARQIAAGLAGLGVTAGDRVGSCRPTEWNGTWPTSVSSSTGTYGADLPDEFGSPGGPHPRSLRGEGLLRGHPCPARQTAASGALPALKSVILIEGTRRAADTFVVGFEALRSAGADRLSEDPGPVDERALKVRPDDLATIVYTSGTSGAPKGAMITHGNIMWTLRGVTPVYGAGPGERLLSFLPLSHIAERMMSELLPIVARG